MEEALTWIFFMAVGLFVLYFLTKTVFTWLKGFLGTSINFLRMLLIAIGVIGAASFVMYPDDTIAFFYQLKDWLTQFWDWLTDGESALKN